MVIEFAHELGVGFTPDCRTRGEVELAIIIHGVLEVLTCGGGESEFSERCAFHPETVDIFVIVSLQFVLWDGREQRRHLRGCDILGISREADPSVRLEIPADPCGRREEGNLGMTAARPAMVIGA